MAKARNERTFLKRTLQSREKAGRLHMWLARAYSRQGQFEAVIQELNHAQKMIEGYLEKTKRGIGKEGLLAYDKGYSMWTD